MPRQRQADEALTCPWLPADAEENVFCIWAPWPEEIREAARKIRQSHIDNGTVTANRGSARPRGMCPVPTRSRPFE